MSRTGVLITAFGGPRSLDEVPAFLTALMGREPSAEALDRVRRRYLVLGGSSPLPDIVTSITQQLQAALDERGHDVPVAAGMRYSAPLIPEAVAALVSAGIDRLVTVSLSPLESPHASGEYRAEVARGLALAPGVTAVEAPSLRTTRPFIETLADNCVEAMRELEASSPAVIFTAHSLPASELEGPDYVEELRETSVTVAALAGLPEAAGSQEWLPQVSAYGSRAEDLPWLVAYQSKGMRPGDWLEPDVGDVVRALPEAGFDGVVFCPVGFATDHMETLYDLDVEACGLAADLDLDFTRASMLNDSVPMIEALLGVVEPLLGE